MQDGGEQYKKLIDAMIVRTRGPDAAKSYFLGEGLGVALPEYTLAPAEMAEAAYIVLPPPRIPPPPMSLRAKAGNRSPPPCAFVI